jgi:hypothetical protein
MIKSELNFSELQHFCSQWICHTLLRITYVHRGVRFAASGKKVQAKVKIPHYRLGQALRAPGGSGSQIFRQSAH